MSLSSERSRPPALVKDTSIRLLNVSASGCLLESDTRIEVGTAGTLRVIVQGRQLVEHIIVVRCQPIMGAGPRCLVGSRFLDLEDGSGETLRHLLQGAEPGNMDVGLASVTWA